MTDPTIFDDYADSYDEAVQDAIGASGEPVEYFTQLKASLARRAVGTRRILRILDFGCGIGNSTRALGNAFPNAQVTGFDPSNDSIARAQRASNANGRITFVTSRAERLPFKDEYFDLVFVACVLHHIIPDERLRWVRELLRISAAQGTLIVFEHNPLNPLTRRVVRDCPFDEGVVLLTPWNAKSLLARAGFVARRPQFYFFFPHALRRLRPLERLLTEVPVGAQYFVMGTRQAAHSKIASP